MVKYKKSVTRECSLFSVKTWYEGESTELKKWLDFGFFNHLFHSNKGKVILYYDVREGEEFERILNEKLTEEFFDNLCDYFFELIEMKDLVKTEKEIYELSVKSWPALTVFHEMSNYPEFGTENMIHRLIRVRKSTESFSYDIENKIDVSRFPEDYIFFRGKVFQERFDKFIKERGIEIIR